MTTVRYALATALALSACASQPDHEASLPSDKEAALEEELPADGKLDSFQRPTEHGALAPGASAPARLTASERHHTWDFALGGAAQVAITTGPAAASGREVDTVLYLYKQKSDGGWGSYVARNDDSAGTRWSALARSLGAGRYRVLVKGYAATTRGAFAVTLGCSGAGCGAAPTTPCLLGDTYGELLANPGFSPLRSARLTAPDSLSPIEREQVIAALHESSHTDVTTVAEAFARADGGEINLTELQHQNTGTMLIAFEYGAGDNSYGAVFYLGTLDRAAAIHDGDLASCTMRAVPGGVQQGELCASRTACATGLSCQGLTGGRGVCVPMQSPAGDGQACRATQPCPGTQLVCAGLTRGDAGLCLPAWLRRSFDDVGPFPIPDAPAAGLTRHLTAYGLATVDMDVELRATIAHPRARDLRVTLENPAGTQVVVFDGAGADPGVDGDPYLELDGPVIGFSGDESVNGTWTLRVVDRQGGQAGSLASWHLGLTSRWD